MFNELKPERELYSRVITTILSSGKFYHKEAVLRDVLLLVLSSAHVVTFFPFPTLRVVGQAGHVKGVKAESL